MGRILARQGQIKRAIALVRAAVELDPAELRFRVYLAELLMQHGAGSEAVIAMREATKPIRRIRSCTAD